MCAMTKPKKIRIVTDGAPPATGTYTQAVRAGNFVFVTGQTGRNPVTCQLEDGLEAQTRRVFSNIEAVLAAAGATLEDIVQVTLIMSDLANFKAIDVIYREWLPSDEVSCQPANTAFQARLPKDALLMLDCVAVVE
jgi:2-iminobutanoate/2-iminopropanoate deaminase